jgi:hypothetical protein
MMFELCPYTCIPEPQKPSFLVEERCVLKTAACFILWWRFLRSTFVFTCDPTPHLGNYNGQLGASICSQLA